MGGGNDNCRVCGYDFGEPPWGASGIDPTYLICPCCFAEAGNDDVTPTLARQVRAEWLAAGAPWTSDEEPPDGLTTEERLAHVPPGFEDEA